MKTNFDKYLEENLKDPEFAAQFKYAMVPYIQQKENCTCCQLIAAINAYVYFTGELPFQPFDENGEYSDEFNQWAETVRCQHGSALRMSPFYKDVGLEIETKEQLVSVADIATMVTRNKPVEVGVHGLEDFPYHAVLIIGFTSDGKFEILNWTRKNRLISHVPIHVLEGYLPRYGVPTRKMVTFSMPGR